MDDRMSIGIFLTDLLKKFPGILYYQSIRERSEENKNIDYLYGLVYLGKRYEGLLEKLLSLNLTEKYVIISRTYIAFMAIIRLDLKKLENQIAELKTFPEDFFLQFPFNPLFCLETIYYYLRFGILRKEALIQLTQFYFFPVIQTNKSYPEAFNEILHLIGLYTISICNNEKKTMRFIIALKKIYPSGSTCYNFLFRILKAELYLCLGKNNDAIRILQELGPYYDEENSSFTAFIKISYQVLKTKLENLNSEPDIDQINELTQFCDEEHCNLIKLHSLAFLLKKNPMLKRDSQFFDQFYFNLVRITSELGCKENSFAV